MNEAKNSARNVVLERQNQLKEEFAKLPDWETRYKRLIEYGKSLAVLPVELQIEQWKVKGCQSQVWLKPDLQPDGSILFQADSDALIVKGLVALLVRVYSNARPTEILGGNPAFLKELGFDTHLSPSRASGLYSMLKQILLYAQAYQALATR